MTSNILLPEEFDVVGLVIRVLGLHEDADKVLLADHEQLHTRGALHRRRAQRVEQQPDLLQVQSACAVQDFNTQS